MNFFTRHQWLAIPFVGWLATLQGTGCVLDATGECRLDDKGNCIEATSSSTGGDCTSSAADGSTSSESTGSQSTGNGSTASSGNSSGDEASTGPCSTGASTSDGGGGTGGEGGSTSSTSSQGGMGGMGGAGGSGGTGGGTTSSTGEGGTGGTGGSGGGNTTCEAGDPDTVNRVTGISSSGNFGLYVHHWNGENYYTPVNNADYTFDGEELPGQVVLAGQTNLIWNTFNGSAPQSVTWHLATNLPSQCNNSGAVTEACLQLVAKSYRCQHAPYNETVDCPPNVSFSNEAQQFSGNNSFGGGYGVVLLHLTCP